MTSTTAIDIRSADAADLDPLAVLVERANSTYREWAPAGWNPPGIPHERSRWEELYRDPAAWNAVAVAHDELHGCVSVTDAREAEGAGPPIAGTAHLSRLFVDPDHWGRGVGGLLLESAVQEMRGRGYERAQLFTAAGNARSRRFYERRGWTAGGETREWQGLLLVRYGLHL